jgi:hypothetical protein
MIQEEMCGKGVEVPEFSSEIVENEDADNEEEGSDKEGGDGSSSSNGGDDDRAEASSECDDASPKVDITGSNARTFVSDCKKLVNSWVVIPSLNGCVVNFNLRRSCKVGLRRT